MNRLWIRGDDRAEARVRAAVISSAITGAVVHPLVSDLDDDRLRAQLARLAKRFVRLLEK